MLDLSQSFRGDRQHSPSTRLKPSAPAPAPAATANIRRPPVPILYYAIPGARAASTSSATPAATEGGGSFSLPQPRRSRGHRCCRCCCRYCCCLGSGCRDRLRNVWSGRGQIDAGVGARRRRRLAEKVLHSGERLRGDGQGPPTRHAEPAAPPSGFAGQRGIVLPFALSPSSGCAVGRARRAGDGSRWAHARRGLLRPCFGAHPCRRRARPAPGGPALLENMLHSRQRLGGHRQRPSACRAKPIASRCRRCRCRCRCRRARSLAGAPISARKAAVLDGRFDLRRSVGVRRRTRLSRAIRRRCSLPACRQARLLSRNRRGGASTRPLRTVTVLSRAGARMVRGHGDGGRAGSAASQRGWRGGC